MTAEAPPTPPPPPTDEAPLPPPPPPPKWRRPRIAIGVGILVVVVAAYALSLLGVHLLQRSEGPLPPLDLSGGQNDEVVVQLRLEELKPVANRLSVNVLVYAPDRLYDKRYDVLNNDVVLRLHPTSDLGDLVYPKGKAPAQLTTTIEAHGDPGNWPFDSYATEGLSAEAFVVSGDGRKRVPARIEVTGSVDGWDVKINKTSDDNEPLTTRQRDYGTVKISMKRAKGPLIFDLGICLVLIALPTLALLVAIPMAMGRRKFLPPFATWYAANLFAIVPLRNILPGAPPPGSLIDQAIVQWVLLALVTAMSLYIFAWVRQGD